MQTITYIVVYNSGSMFIRRDGTGNNMYHDGTGRDVECFFHDGAGWRISFLFAGRDGTYIFSGRDRIVCHELVISQFLSLNTTESITHNLQHMRLDEILDLTA